MQKVRRRGVKLGRLGLLSKLGKAAATLTPNKDEGLSRHLKYQQHQIDALVGQLKETWGCLCKPPIPPPELGRMWSSYNGERKPKQGAIPPRVETNKGKEGRTLLSNTSAGSVVRLDI